MTRPGESLSQDAREELKELVGSLREYLTTARESKRGYATVTMGGGKGFAKPSAETVIPSGAVEGLSLEEVRTESGDCRRCGLWSGRKRLVFGEGNPEADLLFVGEGPGEEEDKQGRPFVGRAGQLLTRIIEAMGLSRDKVYIANIVKCRPPGNRNPKPEEVEACTPYLMKQIEAIRPRVICALGSVAARYFLKSESPISVLRGRFHDYGGIPMMVTYHPAYLLRNPAAKKQVWEDVQQINQLLEGGKR